MQMHFADQVDSSFVKVNLLAFLLVVLSDVLELSFKV